MNNITRLLARARDELAELNQSENDDGALLAEIDAALEPTRLHTYSLAEICNGTGWSRGARFMLVDEVQP